MKASILFLLLLLSSNAKASSFPEIDECERSGSANGCVFKILRELAARRDGGLEVKYLCECRWLNGGNIMDLRYMKMDRRTGSIDVIRSLKLFDTNISNQLKACNEERAVHPACN